MATTIQIIFTAILSSLTTVIASSGFWAYIMYKDKKKSSQQKIIEGIAHDTIVKRCEEYIDRGYVYSDEIDDLRKYFYEPYRELGGNGTAEKAFKDAMNLQMKKR